MSTEGTGEDKRPIRAEDLAARSFGKDPVWLELVDDSASVLDLDGIGGESRGVFRRAARAAGPYTREEWQDLVSWRDESRDLG